MRYPDNIWKRYHIIIEICTKSINHRINEGVVFAVQPGYDLKVFADTRRGKVFDLLADMRVDV
jgi:exoribonuclease II